MHLYHDQIGRVDLVSYMGSDATVVNAARVSFGNDNINDLSDKDEKLIRYLAKHRHTSPFEHCVVTFRVVAPLFVARQHMRHRTFSYNEISRRYTSVNLQFYCPESFRSQHKSNRQASERDEINPGGFWSMGGSNKLSAAGAVEDATRRLFHLYNELLDKGVSREQARMILPQNMYTEYYFTGNLHNLTHFVRLRTHDGAQYEIIRLAEVVHGHLSTLFPISTNALLLG